MSWTYTDEQREAIMCLLKLIIAYQSPGNKSRIDSETQLLLDWFESTDSALKPKVSLMPSQDSKNCKSTRSKPCTATNFRFGVDIRLFGMLRDCFLAHRWKEGIRVLMAIAKRPTILRGITVLHCSLQIYSEMLGLIDDKGLDSVASSFKTYADLTERQVCLNFFLFHAAHQRCDDAKQCFALNRVKGRPEYLGANTPARSLQLNKWVYRAYNGLAQYIDWAVLNCRAKRNTYDEKENVGYAEQRLLAGHLARSALDNFDGIEKEIGVWDIFVTKYVELLEFQDAISQAQAVLQRYTTANGYNANAWKYLYYFYRRHNENILAVEVLQEIVALVPSDALALDLYEFSVAGHVNSDTIGADRIVLLFDLLDYPNWRNVLRPWKLLATELVSGLTDESLAARSECKQRIQRCWTLRSDWWPQFHFSVPRSINYDRRVPRIEIYKATVAQLLLCNENVYSLFVVCSEKAEEHRSYSLLVQATNIGSLNLVSNEF